MPACLSVCLPACLNSDRRRYALLASALRRAISSSSHFTGTFLAPKSSTVKMIPRRASRYAVAGDTPSASPASGMEYSSRGTRAARLRVDGLVLVRRDPCLAGTGADDFALAALAFALAFALAT